MDGMLLVVIGLANINVPVWVAGKNVDVSAAPEEVPGAKFISSVG